MVTLFNKQLVVFIISTFLNLSYGSFLDLNWVPWPFGQNSDSNTNIPAIAVHVPYEQNSEDAKFLADAKKYTDLQLSDLDECQHRVILELKSACSQMTEEDLGKLGVNLLNCQSLIEGRQTFPCTSQMSLRECTSSMDPDTWNSYHLMSNRARAVCFMARQQQFRAMSELTVNRLMQQAHEQTKFMDDLARNQENLGGQILNSFTAVSNGQKSLESHQVRLLNTQNNLQSFVSNNLKSLAKEKALIAAGHNEMARMIAEITNKIEQAQKTQDSHADETRTAQKLLVKDLEKLEQETRSILFAIEESTQRLVLQHNDVAIQYADTLENLSKINMSVAYLTELIENSRSHFDQQYQWLRSWMDTTGQSVDTLISLFGHCCFLLTAMLILGFISAPPKIRVTLIFAWLLNIICILTDQCYGSLNALELAIAMTIITLINWLWSRKTSLTSSPRALLSKNILTNKIRRIWSPREKTPDSFIEETKDENEAFERNHFETLNYTPISHHILDRTRHSFLERSSTPLSNTSSSSSIGIKCDARVNSGRKCRNRALQGQLFCHTHQI